MKIQEDVSWSVDIPPAPIEDARITLTMSYTQARVLASLTGKIYGNYTTARGATNKIYNSLLHAFQQLHDTAFVRTYDWSEEFGLDISTGRIEFTKELEGEG